jgi:hypothetical protein
VSPERGAGAAPQSNETSAVARFSQLPEKLGAGDRVVITAPSGEARGVVVAVSGSDIVIVRDGVQTRFACGDVRTIRTQPSRNPIRNGAIIGALLVIVPAWNACGSDATCWVGGLAVYAGGGALIGKALANSKTVYVAGTGACDGLP